MKPHESPRINKKSIRGDSRDSWPVWNRGIKHKLFRSHGGFLTYAMYHYREITHYDETKTMAHETQIVRAKENQKLSQGGPRQRHRIRHQPTDYFFWH